MRQSLYSILTTVIMLYNSQYRLRPTTEQKLVFNDWLRICRYWYNRQLAERLDWWQHNRSYVDRCSLVCYLSELKDKPNYYNQKKQLNLLVDRDVASSINVKRVGLGLFPTIKRRQGKAVITNSCTNLTSCGSSLCS